MTGRHRTSTGRRRTELPTFYYHEHFVEMLDFVATHYRHVLLEEHQRIIGEFQELPLAAQRLYVRLVNRQGRVFAVRRLRYEEIGPLDAAIRDLRTGGWIGAPGPEHFSDVLHFLTKPELLAILSASFVGMSRYLRKPELIEFASAHCHPEEFLSKIDTGSLLAQRRVGAIGYLLFLYFGKAENGLSQFTMRDLGLVRTNNFRDAYEPRFNERDEALEHFYFATRLKQLDDRTADRYHDLCREAAEWPDPLFSGAAALRDKLAYRLGRHAEKSGDSVSAMSIYRRGESAECNERCVRLLLADGRRDQAKQYLEDCLDNPRSDEEWLFARDLYAQKFDRKRTSAVTDVLRAAETIDIDESLNGSAERAAAAHYEGLGYRAYRVENALWRTLFGLLFWQELFAGNNAALHSPFELLPKSLTDRTFFADNKTAIETRLALLGDTAAVKKILLRNSTQYYGTTNGVFRWRRTVLEALFALLDSTDGGLLRPILMRFCEDYPDARYGYPDLMVIDRQGPRFIEIKAEGDQLRRNQLLRIEQLRAAGLRADVVRIAWALDPRQTYVVVDIETTGGRGESHRVTEIGAVKLRDGQILDRFQTLINPQRPIPPAITRLTGISDAMVADAPLFADIADDFAAFMADAIFVAHNVGFDYRFIAQEFGRLGRPFRYPRLCTCASMRKLYPGHESYSLASLCRLYDIPLQSHHRAMCDAEAAAELLLLVNEKRLALLEASRTHAPPPPA